MKTMSNKVKIAALALAVLVFGATSGAVTAQARDNHGYRDWDHNRGWHHHHDGRIYHSNGAGYYDYGRYYSGAPYPVYVPSAAVYQPFEAGINVTIPIR